MAGVPCAAGADRFGDDRFGDVDRPHSVGNVQTPSPTSYDPIGVHSWAGPTAISKLRSSSSYTFGHRPERKVVARSPGPQSDERDVSQSRATTLPRVVEYAHRRLKRDACASWHVHAHVHAGMCSACMCNVHACALPGTCMCKAWGSCCCCQPACVWVGWHTRTAYSWPTCGHRSRARQVLVGSQAGREGRTEPAGLHTLN